jgi:hypothetical protein
VLLYADVQSRRDSRAVRLVEHTDRLCLVALDDFGSHNWCERARGSDYAELTSPKSLAQQAIARRRRHNREVGIAVVMPTSALRRIACAGERATPDFGQLIMLG